MELSTSLHYTCVTTAYRLSCYYYGAFYFSPLHLCNYSISPVLLDSIMELSTSLHYTCVTTAYRLSCYYYGAFYFSPLHLCNYSISPVLLDSIMELSTSLHYTCVTTAYRLSCYYYGAFYFSPLQMWVTHIIHLCVIFIIKDKTHGGGMGRVQCWGVWGVWTWTNLSACERWGENLNISINY